MKSKILLMFLAALAVLLSVSMASAAVSVVSSYSSTSPTFGSSTTMASNPNADSDSDKNIYATATVTIANTGAQNLTVSSISVVEASGFSNTNTGSDGYINVTLQSSTTLVTNSTGTATLKARIPANLDAVTSELEAAAFKVATVTFTLSDSSTASFDVYMQRKNMLEMTDLDITAGGDKNSYDDGDRVDDAKPGEDVTVEIEAENNYDEDDDDVSIEDVELNVVVDDSDVDADESDSMDDVDAGDNTAGSVTFNVDSDADGTYDMDISVDGEDEFGARHGEKWTLDLKVEKKTHDIVISSASLAEPSVSCSRDNNAVQIRLDNIGKKDEDEVSLYVENSALNLNYKQEKMSIDEGDDTSKTVSFNVPKDMKSGSYSIRVSTYYSGTKTSGVLADQQDLTLTVSDCVSVTVPTTTKTTTSTPSGTEITNTPTGVQVTVPDSVLKEFGVTETAEESQSFTESTGFVVLLTVLVVLALGGVVALVIMLFK